MKHNVSHSTVQLSTTTSEIVRVKSRCSPPFSQCRSIHLSVKLVHHPPARQLPPVTPQLWLTVDERLSVQGDYVQQNPGLPWVEKYCASGDLVLSRMNLLGNEVGGGWKRRGLCCCSLSWRLIFIGKPLSDVGTLRKQSWGRRRGCYISVGFYSAPRTWNMCFCSPFSSVGRCKE